MPDERRPVSAVIADLDNVPVFAIVTNGKLYSTDESGCMIYTQLADASRVLAQLQAAYPAETLELEPLSLGAVLSESGLLVKRDAPPKITIVASPDAKRRARELRANAESSGVHEVVPSAVPKRWRPLAAVPIFHIGALAGRGFAAAAVANDGTADATAADDGVDAELIWPLFFQLSDIDELWAELGDKGTERPPTRAINLAALVAILREPGSAPGKPLVCAPLDALEYVAEKDRNTGSCLHLGANGLGIG